MNKKLTKILKILLSVSLITWLFWKLDWELVMQELQMLNGVYILLFILFQLAAMVVSVKKWQVIAEHQGINFSLSDGLKTYLTGTFVNNFLPSTIGGDIYRGLWLIREGAEKGKAFSTVIFDRFHGLILTLFLALVTGFFVWQSAATFPYFLTISYIAIAGALIFFTGLVFYLPINLIQSIRWTKLRMLFEEALYYRSASVWMQSTWWGTMFAFFGLGVSNYILFLALGHTLPFFAFLGLVFLMALYVSLPISINNIGVKEWAYGVLFVLLGVSFETAVTVALISRVLQTGISLVALPLYMIEKKRAI